MLWCSGGKTRHSRCRPRFFGSVSLFAVPGVPVQVWNPSRRQGRRRRGRIVYRLCKAPRPRLEDLAGEPFDALGSSAYATESPYS